MGVLNKANAQLIKTDTNQNPKYNIESVDQIWFVIDTDDWGEKITTLKANCQAQTNWFVVQSNPCFEVWLFYHFYPFAAFDDMAISQQWKTHLNSKIPGGFDSRKHPIYIKTAIANAEHKFKCESGNINAIGCTEVFKLAEIIYPLVCDKLENGLLGMKA